MNNTQLHSCTVSLKRPQTHAVNSHKNVFKNGFNSENSSICSLSYSYKHYGILRNMVHYYGTNINGTLWYIKHYGSMSYSTIHQANNANVSLALLAWWVVL